MKRLTTPATLFVALLAAGLGGCAFTSARAPATATELAAATIENPAIPRTAAQWRALGHPDPHAHALATSAPVAMAPAVATTELRTMGASRSADSLPGLARSLRHSQYVVASAATVVNGRVTLLAPQQSGAVEEQVETLALRAETGLSKRYRA